jgi:hypothetical protein
VKNSKKKDFALNYLREVVQLILYRLFISRLEKQKKSNNQPPSQLCIFQRISKGIAFTFWIFWNEGKEKRSLAKNLRKESIGYITKRDQV